MSHLRSRRGYSNQTGPNQFTEYGRSRSRRRGSQQTCTDALCVTLLGFVFIIGSIIVQFITEQNYISRYHDIKDIEKTVINTNNYNLFKTITASDPVYITNELHLSSDSQYPLDTVSGFEFKKGFIMHKTIEMYSWTEEKKTKKETSYDNEEERTVTTYNYIKQWTSTYHNNARFKYPEGHYNPQNNQFISSQNKPSYFYASKIKLGKYLISRDIQSLLNEDESSWNDITNDAFNKKYKNSEWKLKNGYIYYANDGYRAEGYQREYGEPNIGDIRIRFTGVNLEGYKATFLGSMWNGNLLKKYSSRNKEKYVYMKVGRIVSIDEIIESFHSENAMTLYLSRLGTLIFMMIGFICTSSLVNYIVSWIPICGNLIGCALNLVAALVGFIFWCLFFAIAYLSARKEIAIGLIVVIIAGLFFMQKSAVDKQTTKEGETTKKD